MRRTILAVVPVVLSMLLIAEPSAHAALTRPDGRLAPSTGSLFGASVQTRPGMTRQQSYADLERRLGRKLVIAHDFYAWDKSFPTDLQRWHLTNGRLPMISWGGTNTTYINNGSKDALIRTRADAIKALAKPVMIRWFWEADGKYAQSDSVSPTSYINAFRRIRRIFQERGAHNAVWVWCPTAYGFETGKAQTYYPGDAHVDWICADGYNWAPTQPGAEWRSSEAIFSAFYRWGSQRPKPLMVGETGVLERNLNDKANWLTDTRNLLKFKYQRIAAWVYFDSKRTAEHTGSIVYDWRVDSSSSSFTAFKSMAADPYFKVLPPPL